MKVIPEYAHIYSLTQKFPDFFSVRSLGEVHGHHLLAFELSHVATRSVLRPTLAVFAGVHGLEVIGIKILVNFLEHILEQTKWNQSICRLLREMQIVGIPIVNPWGFLHASRCNANGVDLMRNAPVTSKEQEFFVGGQSWSKRLPFFKGKEFQEENRLLQEFLATYLEQSPFVMSLDLHSGFGLKDSLWSPYAKTKTSPPDQVHFETIHKTLDQTLKHHIYVFEQQSESYCTSGDLWDYLYDKYRNDRRLFLPLTLEVGSWNWIKKSPTSLLRIRNIFNPAHEHRERRVLRRHLAMLTLLAHITSNFGRVFKALKPDATMIASSAS